MNELIQYAQLLMDFLQSNGGGINIESQQALGQMLQNILQIIQQQGQQEPQVPAQQQPLTEAMPSSNISEFAYDDKNNQLLVRFLGKYPNRQGPLYSYSGVPRVIFDLFQKGAVPARTNGKNAWGRWFKGKNPSMGSSMYTLIKQAGYPYKKVA